MGEAVGADEAVSFMVILLPVGAMVLVPFAILLLELLSRGGDVEGAIVVVVLVLVVVMVVAF